MDAERSFRWCQKLARTRENNGEPTIEKVQGEGGRHSGPSKLPVYASLANVGLKEFVPEVGEVRWDLLGMLARRQGREGADRAIAFGLRRGEARIW
jgi:hypothetical protein